MEILYFTNTKYAWDVQGTMKSIYDEVKSRNHDIILISLDKKNEVLNLIKKHYPQQIWLSSSNLTFSNVLVQEIRKRNVKIIGFGFSDPYYFSTKRFESYDVYVTNHYETYQKNLDKIEIYYNPTACDFRFHAFKKLKKTIDISMIGCTNHPRFTDSQMRPKIVNMLRNDNFKVNCYGNGWKKIIHKNNFPALSGHGFLNVICQSFIGLDVQDHFSPLAHRMLEYAACGTPVITRYRDEVSKIFEFDKEILGYDNYKELKDKLNYYLSNKDKLFEIGKRAFERCKKEHDIKFRVDNILRNLKCDM